MLFSNSNGVDDQCPDQHDFERAIVMYEDTRTHISSYETRNSGVFISKLWTCTDWVWVAIGVGTLLVVLVVVVVIVILVQRCRHKREQAAAYHAEPPSLPTSYGMRDVRGGGGGRGTGIYGGRPSGNGSGSGFGTGGGVNDYALRSPSPTPPTVSVAANGPLCRHSEHHPLHKHIYRR